jgi:hypothetical protein
MRLVLAALALVVIGVAHGQTALEKVGPGGTSIIEVTCVDAMRRISAADKVTLNRQFRSDIVLRCSAVAKQGRGRVVHGDFSYRNRYAHDDKMHSFRLSDFSGQLGEVYGNIELSFLIGLPDRERPWVIDLFFGGRSVRIGFATNP